MKTALDPRAIVIGSMVDHAATLASAVLLPRVAGTNLATPDQVLFALEFAGLLATAVGGYIAARIATGAPLRHGALVGVLALAIGLLSQVGAASELPEWYTASAFALIVPAGVMGGVLARIRANR